MNRVLLVDDDPLVLRGLKRTLASEYDLLFASSASEALGVLHEKGPVPVIVTDYNMPAMTGLQLVRSAREFCEESRFILLTGVREVEIATEAVNSGDVFRLLHKPCDEPKICQAIKDALQDYTIEQGQQQLLQKTFVGGISVVSSLLEDALPEFSGIGSGVVRVVEHICERLGVPMRWEYRIAARLCLVGFASIHHADGKGRWKGMDAVAESLDAFESATAKAAGKLACIPRLELAAGMIQDFPRSTGAFCSLRPKTEGAVRSVGSALVRVGLLAEMLCRQGVDAVTMAAEVKQLLPGIDAATSEALASLLTPERQPEAVDAPYSALRPGMVVAENISSPGGGVMVGKMRRLTDAHIQNLREAAESGRLRGKARVTRISWAAFG